MRLPLLIPVTFLVFITFGLASYKTFAIGSLFVLAMTYGILKGNEVRWKDRPLRIINEKPMLWIFSLSLILIALQILLIRRIPLIDPSAKHLLNPRLTGLTYFLGVPSSIYLFLRGKKYSLFYPVLVALYGYRTPVLVSFIAFGAAYFEEKRVKLKHLIVFSILILAGFLGIALIRGEALGAQLIRIQATTSVLDVIISRAPLHGFYHGALQWAGIRSYILGGYSPRYLVARFLYVKTGVSITPTLLGGMYLDFGVFSILEAYLLGLYYGVISRAKDSFSRVIYYTTLAYGVVGVETGILDLPVYIFFFIGFYLVLRGKYGIKVVKIAE
ncbi:hypothetical protein DRN43_04165 [Thermococci archaeon]|nr:MAG: hypothetical protein DRN43_04165 [Thermococci archaeon]